MLAEGTVAPDFTVDTDEGKSVSLRDYRGRWVVLYFYPKADTPG
jgi:peroxiredoxin Q/BCP